MINIKNIVLGIGILIVYGLALWQGIEAFYPSPKYDEFCTPGRFDRFVPEKTLPATNGPCNFSRSLQEQQNQCYAKGGQPVFEYDDKGCTISVQECDMCNKEFEEASDKHSVWVFIISIIVGAITLFVGYSILSIEPVGSALIASGIWSIFWGSAINWRNFSNGVRFVLLFLALVLLIYIAVRINKAAEKKGFWQKLVGK